MFVVVCVFVTCVVSFGLFVCCLYVCLFLFVVWVLYLLLGGLCLGLLFALLSVIRLLVVVALFGFGLISEF